MKTQDKIILHKMNSEIGKVPVVYGGALLKRNKPTQVFYAYKNMGGSVFFLVRKKDADLLQQNGYNVISAIVPPYHCCFTLIGDETHTIHTSTH
jgi:hypothetical protein